MSVLQDYLSAGLSGALAIGLTHPIDTWVVHKQTGKQLVWSARSLYRGVVPAVFSAFVSYGGMLGTYDFLTGPQGGAFPPLVAAALSGVPEALFKGPLAALKNVRQMQHRPVQGWPITLAKGALAMMSREVPGNAIYLGTYHHIRDESASSQLAASLSAALAFTAIMYPVEALRAQWVTERPLRLTYRGIHLYGLRVVSVTLLLFGIHEALKRRRGAAGAHRDEPEGQQ